MHWVSDRGEPHSSYWQWMCVYTKQCREAKLNFLRSSYNITEQQKPKKATTHKQQIYDNNNNNNDDIKLPHSSAESSFQP